MNGSASAGPTPPAPPYPGTITLSPTKLTYPGEDKPEREWEPEFRETFSKGILKMHLQEYQAGKYTKRYIETYLEFMHLSGMVNNLDYLECKNILLKE